MKCGKGGKIQSLEKLSVVTMYVNPIEIILLYVDSICQLIPNILYAILDSQGEEEANSFHRGEGGKLPPIAPLKDNLEYDNFDYIILHHCASWIVIALCIPGSINLPF